MKRQKSFIVSAAVLFVGLAITPNAFAQIEEVHNILLRGSVYNIVELKKVSTASKLRPWRQNRFYRILGSEHTLKLTPEEYAVAKQALKGVADYRSFDEKHPFVTPVISGANTILTFISYFK